MPGNLKGLEKIGGKSTRIAPGLHQVKIFIDDVSVEGDVVVGRAGGKKALRIRTFDVVPATERGKSHGSKAINALAAWGKSRGVTTVIAEDVDAKPARFWSKNGYRPVRGENDRQDYRRDL
ncbi:MAG: hypothetical protein AAB573_00490 [Patescibacteria group bacterium]